MPPGTVRIGGEAPRILILEARYYVDIADELLAGARRALEAVGATHEVRTVAGALELPTALALAHEAGLIPHGARACRYHGCVALGCVIRGETSHYDIVAGESAHWLLQLATSRHIPLGNGILTVNTHDQAWARAVRDRGDKGGDAAKACLGLIGLMADNLAGAER